MPSPSTSFVYRALLHSGIALAPALAGRRPKVARGLAGRRGVIGRIREWARAQRDPARPLLWMHASSVGEGLQAEVVLRRLRAAHPEWQIAYTFFSPSAAELAGRQPADLAEYLPWDRRSDVDAALAALGPAALVFSKLDLWPELATRAARGGAAVGLIAATVSPRARRARWAARVLLRPGYQVVRLAGAITEADAERLVELGVPAAHIAISGDSRFDSALERARAIRPEDARLRALRDGAVMVAGSTWPEDEDLLLAAFVLLRKFRPDARLVLVPHEPDEEHLTRLDRAARAHGLEPVRARSAGPAAPVPLLVVDRVGDLATLYAGATLAYVGGGYRRGLHSLLEPAACGVAVLFGPRWEGSPDAAALLQRRAAAAVGPEFPDWLDLDSGTTHASQSPLAALWLALLRHPGHLQSAGRRAREYVEAGAGAASRNAGLVERLMQEGRWASGR